jgi:hypothetical protein
MSKRKFVVGIKEVWVREIYVNANTPDEALRMTVNDEYETDEDAESEGKFEFSHVLDEDTWSVEEIDMASA